jgi:hypothetical protein
VGVESHSLVERLRCKRAIRVIKIIALMNMVRGSIAAQLFVALYVSTRELKKPSACPAAPRGEELAAEQLKMRCQAGDLTTQFPPSNSPQSRTTQLRELKKSSA